MGSEKPKNNTLRLRTFSYLRKHYINEFSVANLASKFSGHSFGSTTTFRSTSSASRPWSRVSRRIWKDSTLENSYQCVKTAWPVPVIEALFLPQFKIDFKKYLEFEVINVISRGAFGKVYRVMNKESQEYFAMKVLSKSKVLRDNYIAQVKDEVKIQSMCGHHPFIISSPQYWQNRRKLFIVSEHIEGGDLFDLCEKYGPLPEELVKVYVAELGSALDFLHNAGVIYRDLKAENILLDLEGHIVLIDFGLSKWLKYGQRTNTLCGTLQYMAPEIFSLNGYGHAVDWWALGTLTVYLLTAKFVSSGNSKTPGELPKDCAEISKGAVDLVKRLLTVDPTRRLRSLLTLQTLTFFFGFDLSKAKMKKINPKVILEKHFPNGPKNGVKMIDSNVIFFDFENMSPVIV